MKTICVCCFSVSLWLLLLLVSLGVVPSFSAVSPPGWEQWLMDNVDEFENVMVAWDNSSQIPEWLYGTYLKNGPARISFGPEGTTRSYQNQMDGWAKINKFHISKDGGVVFSAKFLKTAVYQKNVEANDLVPQATLGPVNPEGWSLRDMQTLQENEIMNTDVTIDRMGNEFIASTDLNKVNVFDVETLELKEFLDPFGQPPPLSMRLASCAHWRKDITSNDMYNYDISWTPGLGHFLQFYRFPDGDLRNPQEVNSQRYRLPFQTLVHYFSLTEHYAVFFLYPIHMQIPRAIFNRETPMHNMLEHVAWEGDTTQTEIMIIDLESGELLKPRSRLGLGRQRTTTSAASLPLNGFNNGQEGFYATHHVNAFETTQGSDPVLVTDVIIPPHYVLQNYTDRTVMLEAEDDQSVTSNLFNIVRFTTNLDTYETTSANWNDLFPASSPEQAFVNQFDFPMVNPNYVGREYCFAYGQSIINFQRHYLVKKNLCEEGQDLVWYKEHHYTGEPYFVPNPMNAESEDDGILLNIVLDGTTNKSYLLVLDAKTMTELTVAKLDTHIPMSLHGNWFQGALF